MPASLSDIASLLVAELNAATTFTATPTDPRFYTSQISKTILALDAALAATIGSNRAHSRLKDYLTTSSSLTSGSQLVSRVGSVLTVQAVLTAGAWPFQTTEPAKLKTYEEIQRENVNPSALTWMAPAYALDGDVIYTNKAGLERVAGRTVRFDAIYPQYTDTGAVQAAVEFTAMLYRGALEMLSPVEGTNVGMGQHYGQGFARDLALVARNEVPQAA